MPARLPRLLLLLALLAGPGAAAAEPAAAESADARITRLEAEERLARRGQESTRALEILRELVEALDGKPRQPTFLLSLYLAEQAAGNRWRASRVRQRLVDHPQLTDGVRIALFHKDAQYRAKAGDASGARALWQEGNAMLARLAPDDPATRPLRHRFLSRQAGTEAILLRSEGDLPAAAAALQRALAENEIDRRYWSGPGASSQYGERNLATAEGERATLASELIIVQLYAGRLGAAELAALDWLAATREAGAQRTYATQALKQYGDVLLASHRFPLALATFDRVIADYRAAGLGALATSVIHAKKSRAQALMALGRWQEALAAFQELELATKGNLGREILRGGTDRALVRAVVGQLRQAEIMIDASLANLAQSYAADHPGVIRANGVKAFILARWERDAGALPLFRQYFEDRGAMRGDADAGESALAGLRHRLILEAYLALLARQPPTAEILGEAFRVADTLRAGRVQQAIAASAVRGGIGDPALAELVRSEQNLGGELAALYRALAAQSPVEGETNDLPDLRPRIRQLESRRQAVLADLRRRFPEYDRLVRPAAPTPSEVGQQLAEGEMLIAIYSAPEASYVFAVGRNGEVRLQVVKLGATAIAEAVQRLRAAVDIGDTPLERLPAFDTATAHDLYRQLLEPLRPAWGEARHLIVSAAGALGQIPFSLLVERPGAVAATPLPFAGHADIPWLVRDRAISHVPSAAAFVALRRHPASGAGRRPFVGFGDPDFGAPGAPAGVLRSAPRRGGGGEPAPALRAAYRTLPPLPDTRDEVLTLARTLRAKPEDALLGAAASRANVLGRDLSRWEVVAFATHGLQPGELPGLDEPALALALPASEAQSPLLTLSDVLGLKLDADWVVLSACNTAGADGEAAEALSGLGRGFFFAGARALLVTHWPVESASARQLVSALFARQDATLSRAEALRQAQLELMGRSAGQSYSLAHPLFWAPFALVGDGGLRRK